MKKLKEFLIFIAIFIAPIALFFIARGAVDMISDTPRLIGIDNYIRLFFKDKTFLSVLFNTFAMQIIISFIVSAVLAVIIFLLRKKIKAPRLIFYIGSIILGNVVSWALPWFKHFFIALYVGIVTAFVFWILELIVSFSVKRE